MKIFFIIYVAFCGLNLKNIDFYKEILIYRLEEKEMSEKISMVIDDTNEEVEFFVVEQTRINGMNYLLVTENETDEEADAYILKDTSADEDAEAVYEIVEDDEELEAVSRIFSEILDDIDIEK